MKTTAWMQCNYQNFCTDAMHHRLLKSGKISTAECIWIEDAGLLRRRIWNPSMEVSLPHSVEQMLQRICTEQQQPPPEAHTRRNLASLGEESALELLRKISHLKIRNLSALINYMVGKAAQGSTICFVFFFYQLLRVMVGFSALFGCREN